MQNSKQVIQFAKQSALNKFSALIQRAAHETDNNLVGSLSKNAVATNYRTLSAARQFLREEGNVLLKRLESIFQEQMERAMRTMYSEVRPGLGNFSAETMTLLDDESVNRQIEVGHLVDRLRDACDENLGRLNIMIAQLHDKPEVRERENPFRPYLIAHTLHDVLRKMVSDEETAALLFKYFADSLALFLPDYYAELCEVFDAGGVKAHLIARPGTLKRHQREQLARRLSGQGGTGGGSSGGGGGAAAETTIQLNMPANFDQNVIPSLQRLLKLMQQQTALAPKTSSETISSSQATADQAAAFQDFVTNIFSQPPDRGVGVTAPSFGSADGHDDASDDAPVPVAPPAPPVSSELLGRLDEYQKMAARGRAVNEQITPLQNQLHSVREQIDPQSATQPERIAIDVIAVLFEFILADEQIPEGMRAQIGRLQIPFLKAALIDPGLLQQPDHPSRQLLNRMGMVAVGLLPDTELGQSVATEIKRIVKKILDGFEKDMTIFSDCYEELEQFMADKLRHADNKTALSIDAMEEAEKVSVIGRDITASLREILLPLNVDKRVVDFIVDIWARVLVRVTVQKNKDADPNASKALFLQQRDVLPELVWSAQDKQTPQDRSMLMRLLPILVKKLKSGLMLLNMSEEETKQALDQLVAVHTQVLRNNEAVTTEPLPSLDELRKTFSGFLNQTENTFSNAIAPPVDADVIESSLSERGVSVSLDIKPESTFSSRLDEGSLSQLKVGACIECWVDNAYKLGRLIWMGKNQSIFMFKLDENFKPLVYSATSLSRAMRDGHLNLIEAAPTFERAVESLLLGTEVMQKKQTA